MNVLLKPELEKFVAEKVQAGEYADARAIVNEALEVMKDQDQFTPAHEEHFKREIRRGLDQLNLGQRADVDAEKIIAHERQFTS
jgi:putative addiction module CopG family antidote